MTPATLIRQAETDRVKLALSATGTIKAIGHGDAVSRWLPLIRKYKTDIMAALDNPQVTPSHVSCLPATYHGLTLAEIKTATGDDWPDSEHDADMLHAFAAAVAMQRLRERLEVPGHYTQGVHCDGCGPVWLWQGSPARVMACPWCFVRVQGKTPPAASYADLLHLTGE